MKLENIRVLDLSNFLPGPFMTLALADHGAEVIKIEAPGEGDPGRHIGLSDGEHTVFFRNLNRGKKSVVLNLKETGDRERFMTLVETADVVVETFRPGVARRLGVDYEAVATRNPAIVYCSISAFGQDGPNAPRPAHDMAVQALAGVLSLNLGSDDTPAIPAVPISDLVAGLMGLSGTLMALIGRERTGRGDYLDISMHDAMLGSMLNVLGPALAEARNPVVKDERTTGGAAFYNIYATADGRQVVLAGQEPKFMRNLLGALDRLDLLELCERGPGSHQEPVKKVLQAHFATMSLAEASAFLAKLDVCWGPVNSVVEALDDPHTHARGMILRDEAGRRHIGSPIRFRTEPATPRLSAPELNADEQSVFTTRS